MKALVVLSGGLDSTVALATAIEKYGPKQVEAISFFYGSRHNQMESSAASAIASHYRINRIVIDLDFMYDFASALGADSDRPVPEGHYAQANMSLTVVPGRNAIMLSIATGFAVNHDCKEIWYGAHSGDHPIYPDCRPEFINSLGIAFMFGYGVELVAPFKANTKADIVKLGTILNAPLQLTYSCYNGDAEHCGRCGTCVERAEAFALAEIVDPTHYTDPAYWREVCK